MPVQTRTDSSAPAVPGTIKTCGCGHRSLAKNTDPTNRDVRISAATEVHQCGESHSNPHDRDCPAVNPAPLARDAGTPSVTDVPTDDTWTPLAVWIESLPLAGATAPVPSERHTTPKRPLFITLLTLRN